MWQELEAHLGRPGPKPERSDIEMIAICLIGRRLGRDVETELSSHMRAHQYKFPVLPEHSRFNRRRCQLQFVIHRMRHMLLARLVLARGADVRWIS